MLFVESHVEITPWESGCLCVEITPGGPGACVGACVFSFDFTPWGSAFIEFIWALMFFLEVTLWCSGV